MNSLKQLISDEEKHRRFLLVFNQYEKEGLFNIVELADDLDFAKNTLYKIRKGTTNPPDILIYKFSEYFKKNPAWFFGRAEKLTDITKEIPLLSETEVLRLHELSLEIAALAVKMMSKK